MNRLAVTYQEERPNGEVSDLTVLVIQALGLLVSKIVYEKGELGEPNDGGELCRMKHLIITAAITNAVHSLIEVFEMDLNPDYLTSSRIGTVLSKMRLTNSRQPRTGKKGWLVSLDDVIRWGKSYGLEPSTMPGLNVIPHIIRFTTDKGFTEFTPPSRKKWEGEL